MPIDLFDDEISDPVPASLSTTHTTQKPSQTTTNTHQFPFESYGISFELSQTLAAHSITTPTKIQQLALLSPLKNTLIVSPTASGKTLCFLLPALQNLTQNPLPFHSIFIAPTRELAQQIFDQVSCFSRVFGIQPVLITGGASIALQTGQLRDGPYIVIATPGRLAALLNAVRDDVLPMLRNNKFLVLDEADFFFTEDKQFNEDLTSILKDLPKEKRVILATASNSKVLNEFAEVMKYEKIVSPEFKIPGNIKQEFKVVPQGFQASSYLLFYLSVLSGIDVANKNDGKPLNQSVLNTEIRQGIVFAESGEQTEIINRMFLSFNIKSVTLHGRMKQDDRYQSIQQFRLGQAFILVATDLAARGLDIPKVDFVFQMNVPRSDVYLHRIGRVGRGGQKGTSLMFIKATEFLFKEKIEADHQVEITEIKNFNNWCWNGKYDHFNEDWFLREIFPKVSKAEITAKMDLQMENIGDRINQRKLKYQAK